ncbi:GNAT family N-acetyltransferase [Amycolatopsis albispora]|uniref:Aminoglycoside 2'-N-acetyltransferase n=1 Tax=Amycolatopsis albispora TaxID=1804986 RepID=A0A344L251_9PSEU|nr:GNAT family N-acetyltransferase [Amycolatopsis albispora]AXB42125.1 aminoglycoside 2'-N-acetyltransferase [Amycolatopsis albispora]
MPLRITHTADLTTAELVTVRKLLDEVFEGDFSDEDWDHSLGGMHVMLWEDGALIGHGSIVQRRLTHGGRALRTGYVEAVAVRADRRRRGHAGTIMAELERIARGAYELGALSASDEGAAFYAARGWQRWQGPTSVFAPDGVRRTEEDDDGVFVLPGTVPLDLTGALICDWRNGDAW